MFLSHVTLAVIAGDVFSERTEPSIEELYGEIYVDRVSKCLSVACEGVVLELNPELQQYWARMVKSAP